MNDTGTQVAATRQQIYDDFHALATHAEALVRATAQMSGESVAAAREKVLTSVHRVRDQVKTAQTQAMDATREAAQRTDAYVHEKPWQMIGGALVVGVLIGALAASSRR